MFHGFIIFRSRETNEVIGPIFCDRSNPLSVAWSPRDEGSGVKMLWGGGSVQSGVHDMHRLPGSGDEILIDTSYTS